MRHFNIQSCPLDSIRPEHIVRTAIFQVDAFANRRFAGNPAAVMPVRVDGEDLASQPTHLRFENAFDRTDLYRMGIALADTVIERHRRRLKRKVKRITIDLDPTDDPR